MFKQLKIWAVIILLLAVSAGIAWYANTLKQELKRVELNQNILLTEKDSTIRSLKLDKREIETLFEQDQSMKNAIIDSMDIKIKDLQSIVKAKSGTKIEFKTILKDTTITKHDTIYKYKSFYWEDHPWTSVNGIVFQDTVMCSVNATDTIYVGNYLHYEGWFLPRLFGNIEPRSDVENVNPYIDVHVIQSIRHDKKRWRE